VEITSFVHVFHAYVLCRNIVIVTFDVSFVLSLSQDYVAKKFRKLAIS